MTAQTFLNFETLVPEVIACPGAEIAIYTRRAPDKETENEDSALVLVHDPDTLIVAVADGAGGYAGGDVASACAVQSLVEAFRIRGEELPVRAAVVNAFERAHQEIRDRTTGAGTTLAVAEISQNALRTYHAGDSGILVTGNRGRIKLQTVSHSPTGYGVESGLLDEMEALSHEERHIVSNLVGREPMSVEIGSPVKLARRDTVVLASDGLFDNVYGDEIVQAVRKGRIAHACATLARTVELRMKAATEQAPSKPDDLTIMLVRRTR